jgi:Secretion system C-terminal sorting domain
LGAEDVTKANWNIEVYPNPAKDFLTLKVPSENSINNFMVFDVAGKNVKSGELNNSNTINLQALPNGHYIIKFVNTNGDSQLVKIVKE